MEEPSFGEWLERQIVARGLGQREFATKAGVGHAAIRTWITGFSKPEWHTCRGIADALGVPRSEVRARAGYVDPGDEPALPAAGEPDGPPPELLMAWRELSAFDQEAALRTVLALRDYSKRRR
jgi:transcriptional regulator with XRE-family HTH domain